MPQPGGGDGDEPDQRDRAEERRDLGGAARLHREQHDQDHDRQRHDVRIERRRHDLQAFDRRQHRQRRRDDGVAVEQRAADDAEQDDDAGAARPSARGASAISASVPPSPLLSARSRMSTYLRVTMTISAQMISDRMPSTTVSLAGIAGPDRGQHRFAQRVERAGADVAVDDADAAERQRPEAGRGGASADAAVGRRPAGAATVWSWDVA